MAKKIRKRRPSFAQIIILLLIPWIVMGLIAYAGSSAGWSEPAVYGAALAGALGTTLFVHLFLKKGRTRVL